MKLTKILTAGILSLTCLFTAVGCSSSTNNTSSTSQSGQTEVTPKETAKTYVAIDINPSVELTLSEDQKVLSVKSLNDDGKVLLFNANIVGKDVSDATEDLADLAVDLGYITDTNNGVNVSVCGDKEEDIFNKVKDKFEQKQGVKVESDVKVTLSKELQALKEQYADNQAIQELTVNKYRLIKSAMEKDTTLTIETAVTKDIDDLIEIIKDFEDQLEDLDDEAEEKIEKIEKEYERKEKELSDACYNLIDQTQSTALTLLRTAYNYFDELEEFGLEQYEKVVLTEEQLKTIAEKLNITEENLQTFIDRCKNADGEITIDEIEDEIDRLYRNLTKEEREEFESLYDNVDDYLDQLEDELEENIVIPEDLKTEITNAINTISSIIKVEIPEDITTLEDLEDCIENILEEIEGKIELIEKSFESSMEKSSDLKKQYEQQKESKKAELEKIKSEKKQKIEQEKQAYKNKMEEIISQRKAEFKKD